MIRKPFSDNLNKNRRRASAILIRYFLFLISYFLFNFAVVSADCVVSASDYSSLSEIFDSLPSDVDVVEIRMPPLWEDGGDGVVSLPADREIESVRLLPADDDIAHVRGIERICANGMQLIIGSGIRLDDTSIYGGACVSEGEALVENSSLVIEGTVGFVFGGGFAENGSASTVRETSVLVEEGGLVYYEVFGGGHAVGTDSLASVENSEVILNGTTDYVLGGSYAEAGGRAECARASVIVGESGEAAVALFAGGSAADADSYAEVGNAFAYVNGTAHWAFCGDFAFSGGKTALTGSGRLEIQPSGSSANVFMGSFASDPGSYADINTAELLNCGKVDLVTKRSLATDSGEAKTMVPAEFKCEP